MANRTSPQPSPRSPTQGESALTPLAALSPFATLVAQGEALGEGVGRRSGGAGGPRRSWTLGNPASGPERPGRSEAAMAAFLGAVVGRPFSGPQASLLAGTATVAFGSIPGRIPPRPEVALLVKIL